MRRAIQCVKNVDEKLIDLCDKVCKNDVQLANVQSFTSCSDSLRKMVVNGIVRSITHFVLSAWDPWDTLGIPLTDSIPFPSLNRNTFFFYFTFDDESESVQSSIGCIAHRDGVVVESL